MNEEIWRDIKNYEGLYQVSNWGRVKTIKTQKIRKLVSNHKGYLLVKLCKNGISVGFSVHRLVAEAFIPNPDNLPQVNHINENKTDNRVENLEWCTNEYNHNYGTRNERARLKKIGNPKMKTCLGKFGKDHHSSKSIIQFTLDDELVRKWDSASDAHRCIGVNYKNISSCCNGQRLSAGGFKWEFYDTDRYLIALMDRTLKQRKSA